MEPASPRPLPGPGSRGGTGHLLALLLTWATLSACYLAPAPLPSRPVAAAGADRFAPVGAVILLDASSSTTENGSILTYSWSFEALPEGSRLDDAAIQPNETASPTASFIPDWPGRYVIRLEVADALAKSIGDFVLIDAEGSPLGPIADAGPDQEALEGHAVYLDGSASASSTGSPLYYRWTLEGTPTLSTRTSADLDNAYTPYPTLIVDAGGVFTLALVVSDGHTQSAPDYVFLSVLSDNAPPIADAGSDDRIEACTTVGLDGTDSYDIDGDPLLYTWSLLIAPLHSQAGSSLDAGDDAAATFYADRVGIYVAQLVVSDGEVASQPAMIELEAHPRADNAQPISQAGADQTVVGKVSCNSSGYCPECPAQVVTLNGTSSTDPDGDPLSWQWQMATESPGTAYIVSPSSANTTAELRGAKAQLGATFTTLYQIELQVTDCPGATHSDMLEIAYQCTGGT